MDAKTDRPDALTPIDLAREPDFALGPSKVSPSTREVLRGSERELLEPRLMQVLVALFQANGRVVSRDELIARCWEGRIVGEDAINRAISRLRHLSEVDRQASFQLETIPKVGYRLIASQSLAATDGGPAEGLPAVQPKGKVAPLVFVAIAAIVLVAVLFWFYPRPVTLLTSSQQPPGPARTSVAVLPFLNLSGDPKEEYFSDGMTEEITAALAKIPKLPVVSRTSAFQFKGKAEDVRAVGRALNAAYLLEGSVRKADNRVRVTAQLVRADTGDHIWTESYDRELKDVFSVQENVAQAIAQALKIPLALKAGETLVSDRTTDISSYQDYLRARALFRARDIEQAIPILEQTVARDPGYAPAWALLARNYQIALPSYVPPFKDDRELEAAFAAKAEQAAQHALQLDPRNAIARSVLAGSAEFRLEWARAKDQFQQALALDANDPDILQRYAGFLASAGYVKQSLALRQKLHTLEPLGLIYSSDLAQGFIQAGQYKAAIDLLRKLPGTGPFGVVRSARLAGALAEGGRFAEAADTLLAIPPNRRFSKADAEGAARVLRDAPTPPASIKDLHFFNPVYTYVGITDQFLSDERRELESDHPKPGLVGLWGPRWAGLRKTEQFKSLMRDAKLPDYWRTHGWPDHCHPVGAEDFACD